jgi:hypothetical protein
VIDFESIIQHDPFDLFTAAFNRFPSHNFPFQ